MPLLHVVALFVSCSFISCRTAHPSSRPGTRLFDLQVTCFGGDVFGRSIHLNGICLSPSPVYKIQAVLCPPPSGDLQSPAGEWEKMKSITLDFKQFSR